MPCGTLSRCDALKQVYALTNSMFFHYLQLRHAITAQFPNKIQLTSDPIDSLLPIEELAKSLSALYFALLCTDSTTLTTLYQRFH